MEGGDWLSKSRRWAWARAKRPFVIPWLEGVRVWVAGDDQLLKSLFLTGLFEPNEFLLLDRLLRPGMEFVDVGANLGLYTLFAARKVGMRGVVLALEPSSREFQKLRANVELNRMSQVRLQQVAASDRSTQAELLVAEEERSGHNTLGAFGYGDTLLASKEVVRLERLDEIVRLEGLKSVDVIKMDIEGGELFALQGALRTLQTFHPILLIEMADRSSAGLGSTSAHVWDFLSGLGYCFCSFGETTGAPVPAVRKETYDGENLVAIHRECRGFSDGGDLEFDLAAFCANPNGPENEHSMALKK